MQEIDLSDLLGEVEPVTIIRLSKDEAYPVYRNDDLPVEGMLKTFDISVRLMEADKKYNQQMDELRQQVSALDPEDEEGFKTFQVKQVKAEMERMPLLREYIEVTAGMPPDRLKKMSTKRIMSLFNAINSALNPNPQEVVPDAGKSELTTTTSS